MVVEVSYTAESFQDSEMQKVVLCGISSFTDKHKIPDNELIFEAFRVPLLNKTGIIMIISDNPEEFEQTRELVFKAVELSTNENDTISWDRLVEQLEQKEFSTDT